MKRLDDGAESVSRQVPGYALQSHAEINPDRHNPCDEVSVSN